GWATLGALLLMLTAAYASVWRLLRPLQAITAGVEAYGRGQFKVPIAVQRRDELGDLSQRINAMASSLQGMLDAKRALLLAMSHELRSPLTRARVNAELLDDSPERQALLRDMGEMRDLISTLLESERLANVGDGRDVHSALQAEATDLAQLARDTAATHEGPPVTLQLDNSIGPVSIDPTRVRLLLRNLLANARRHAPDASTPPTLYLQREADGQLALGLRDHGPGVPADVLPHLAEAFYRPDAARTRSSGGVGLGLHLCRLVAQAHGGQLRIRRADPGLDVAMVWAPLH
ncbi:MAG: HAMP domain-containing sensor histidine kinase, partial [Rubrivivax sp.]|nr:HAMP domain-containing sensor histidine kinase [Rubrivivax sp.]